jgi:hypothetical protein
MLTGMLGIPPEMLTRLRGMAELFSKVIPPFDVQTVTNDAGQYIAVLFDHTPENIKRVNAISDLFSEILPPFDVAEDFYFDGNPKPYSALIFPIKEGLK